MTWNDILILSSDIELIIFSLANEINENNLNNYSFITKSS